MLNALAKRVKYSPKPILISKEMLKVAIEAKRLTVEREEKVRSFFLEKNIQLLNCEAGYMLVSECYEISTEDSLYGVLKEDESAEITEYNDNIFQDKIANHSSLSPDKQINERKPDLSEGIGRISNNLKLLRETHDRIFNGEVALSLMAETLEAVFEDISELSGDYEEYLEELAADVKIDKEIHSETNDMVDEIKLNLEMLEIEGISDLAFEVADFLFEGTGLDNIETYDQLFVQAIVDKLTRDLEMFKHCTYLKYDDIQTLCINDKYEAQCQKSC